MPPATQLPLQQMLVTSIPSPLLPKRELTRRLQDSTSGRNQLGDKKQCVTSVSEDRIAHQSIRARSTEKDIAPPSIRSGQGQHAWRVGRTAELYAKVYSNARNPARLPDLIIGDGGAWSSLPHGPEMNETV